MTSPTNLIPHGAYLCPTCGADLINATGIHDVGIKKMCLGPIHHYWMTPPVSDIYPDMPTARQRVLQECLRGLRHELFMLPEAVGRAEVEMRQEAIKMWADMIVEATREELA